MTAEASALSALRDCRVDLLRASVTAAHAELYVSRAREVVGKVHDAITLVDRLLAGHEGPER